MPTSRRTLSATLRVDTLTNANLANAILTNASLDYATLTNANLSGTEPSRRGFITVPGPHLVTDLQHSELCEIESPERRSIQQQRGWLEFLWTKPHRRMAKLGQRGKFHGSDRGGNAFDDTLTSSQLYATLSYSRSDLRGIWLQSDLNGWNLTGQNLTGGPYFTGALFWSDFTELILLRRISTLPR